jgi:hypothetical protein
MSLDGQLIILTQIIILVVGGISLFNCTYYRDQVYFNIRVLFFLLHIEVSR